MTSILSFALMTLCSFAQLVHLEIDGIEEAKGQLIVTVFHEDQADAYPTKRDQAKMRHVHPIKQTTEKLTLPKLPLGKYALSVHHDEDGNDQLNTNFNGIPSEPLGASNNAKGSFGPPSFEDAQFELPKDGINLKITVN